jgi:hypothetical protein
MLVPAFGGVMAVIIAAAASVPAPGSPSRTVPCRESIATTEFPDRRLAERRYRVILDEVSVSPPYLPQVVSGGSAWPGWPYWQKQGIVVRASGATVTITVPPAWRKRVAITWGYNNRGGPFSSLTIAGCQWDDAYGHAYSGGIHLRMRAACVPLLFRVGDRTQTVRFGVGQRCLS